MKIREVKTIRLRIQEALDSTADDVIAIHQIAQPREAWSSFRDTLDRIIAKHPDDDFEIGVTIYPGGLH